MLQRVQFAPKVARSPATAAAIAVALLGVYYAFLITDGNFHLIETGISGAKPHFRQLDLVFNDMLLRLLRGQFDVDPDVITFEAFVTGGKTYAYFGIFPALVRLPLLWIGDFRHTNVSALTCLVAVCLASFFKLLTLATIYRSRPDPRSIAILLPVACSLAFGEAQVQFLKISVYQEAMLWTNAMIAGFIYLSILGLLSERGFTVRSSPQWDA